MHTQDTFYLKTEDDSTDPLSRLCPDLRPYLLGIRFDNLDSAEVRRIFSGDVEKLLREIIRDMREKGAMA